MNWLNRWLSDLPSVNLKVAASVAMFMGFCVTCFAAILIGRTLDEGTLMAVGGVILAFGGITSYDFKTKRVTEIVRPPETMAGNAASVTTAQTADVAQPVVPLPPEGVIAPVVPADATAVVTPAVPGAKRARRTKADAVPPVVPRATPLPDAVPPAPKRDD